MLERTTMAQTDAVERPLTLVEKLRNRRKEWASDPHYWMYSNLIGDVFNDVVGIVKQHSEWISVDERLPIENDGRVSWGVNAYKKYILVNIVSRGIAMTCRFNLTDKCFETADKVTHWMPLPQPPSEAQDD